MAKMDAPKGFEYHYNPITGKTILRPIKGFSEEYLIEETFVPEKEVKEVESEETDNKTKNSNLHSAKNAKYDEFYTRIEDICEELKHYKEFFKDKVVYCPCDKVFNLGRSEFFNYFANRFHQLGLKKLVCTQYNPNGHGYKKEVEYSKNGIEWEYNGEYEDGTDIDESMVDTTFLRGNGSFDSEECIELMKEADVIVTNPPFSKECFRPFVKQMMELDKKFIIVAPINSLTYKDIFPYFKENKIWLGYRNVNRDFYFNITDEYKTRIVKEKKEGSGWKEIGGVVCGRLANACWFTNIEHSKRKEELYLSESYSEEKYPKYDNYDAIEVSKVEDIPCDYDGVMGVPITFMGCYCPEQFEIIGLMSGAKDESLVNGNDGRPKFYVNGRGVYARILVRKKQKGE